MPELLVVEPVFAERLWAGTTLRQLFGAAVPEGLLIGECWAVSGMPGMSGTIRGHGQQTLREAWAAGLVTGSPQATDFPLLCKFLDPRDWLSVQVHPNDAQAQALEDQPRGKAECWLVVAADEGAELILGHRAQTSEQLREALADGTLMDLLIKLPVVQDDFLMVRAGEVHSVGPGMLIYEVQQSSDLTYRLYDFDRVGPDGQPRELHVEKGFSVVSAPHDPGAVRTAGPWQEVGRHARHRTLVTCPQFVVQRWETQRGEFTMEAPGYRVLTIVGGHAELTTAEQSVELGLGSSVVIPVGTGPVHVAGDVIMVSTDPGDALG
ncbi:MAG TPA: type I phosphomannose isomerase catalytic subunit [Candidatus Nanopelagicales bacterium]